MQKSAKNYLSGQHLALENLTSTDFGLLLTLQRTKTLQFNERALTIPLVALPGDDLCPVQALIDMWDLCPAATRCSLFRFAISDGSSSLLHAKYNKLLRTLGSKANLKLAYSAHSLRKGGATCAFAADVDDTMIKLQGDWVSDAYRRYISFSMDQKLAVPTAIASKLHDAAYLARCRSIASASTPFI